MIGRVRRYRQEDLDVFLDSVRVVPGAIMPRLEHHHDAEWLWVMD
jgi:hypothetical protein